jgi:hypothetical protein
VNLPRLQAREQFAQLEHELTVRKDHLIDTLDDKTKALELAEAKVDSTKKKAEEDSRKTWASKEKSSSWLRLAKQVDELADDMCLLLALFIEHEIIDNTFFNRWIENEKSGESELQSDGTASSENPTPTPSSDQGKAVEALRNFLGDYLSDQGSSARRHVNSTTIGLWIFFLTMGITSLWSLFPGCYELALKERANSDGYTRVIVYTSTAFIAYIIPITVALAIRDGSQHLRRWKNIWEVTWTQWLPQLAFVLAASFSAATAVIIALALWRASLDPEWNASGRSLGDALGLVFAYNAPIALRGALLAVILIATIDAWARQDKRKKQSSYGYWSRSLAFRAGLTMGILGGSTRFLSAWQELHMP